MNAATASITSTKTRAKRRTADTTGHASLLAAFAAAQHDGRKVEKRGRDDERDFAYARAEDIVIEAKAILEKHGLAVLPTGTKLRKSDIVEVGGVELVASFVLVHPASGQTQDLGERVWPVVAHHDQTLGDAHASADTSLLAYFLRGLLQMPRVEEGRDIDAAKHALEVPMQPPKPLTAFARVGLGSGARRAGGATKAVESITKLTRQIDGEFARLNIADEERDAKARKVLGREPATAPDLRELLAKLKKMRA